MSRFLKKLRKNKKGFTLIELIVVIVILAILAAVIVPRILGFVQDARDSADAGNARLLYNSVVLGLSAEGITAPALADAYNTIGGLTGIDTYIDEWPNDSAEAAMVVVIDADGASVAVYDSTGATLLAGGGVAYQAP